MSIFPAIAQEIRYARELDRPTLWIRVTIDALAGSVTSTPITPERLRVVRPMLIDLGKGAVALPDPEAVERALEILIHPEDWRDLLLEKDSLGAYVATPLGDVKQVYGLPVIDT